MTKTPRLVQLIVMAAILASVSLADVLPFQWSTTGSFSNPGLPSGLSFTGVNLSPVTNADANGNLSINLGYFNFANISTDYTGTFTLTIDFIRPYGATDPAYSVTLVADANAMGSSSNDRLTMAFPTASQYGFNGLDGTGNFTLQVNNVSDFRTGSHSDVVNLIGNISGATLTPYADPAGAPSAVPEPAPVALLLTVLGCFGLGVSRRKPRLPQS
jgi:hypothetical protein